jgi:hypothetical protein
MLDLPGVTLCCIDTANHALAARALRQSAAGIRFARSLFLTDRKVDEPGIEVRTIAALASCWGRCSIMSIRRMSCWCNGMATR